MQAVAAERFSFWRPPLDRVRSARLVDYLIFDYRPAKYGRSAAEEYFAERGPILSPQWRELLEQWQNASMRLFAFEGWSSEFARVRAVLPEEGREIEVLPLERANASIASNSPVALRALPVGPSFVYPTWPTTFGSRTVDEVAAAITARHHAFVRRERIVSFEEFLRLDGTAFDEEAVGGATSQIILPGRA